MKNQKEESVRNEGGGEDKRRIGKNKGKYKRKAESVRSNLTGREGKKGRGEG